VEARRAVLDALALKVLDAVARISEEQGRWHEALHWHGRRLRMTPTHEPSHLAVLQALVKLGHRDEAKKQCHRAIETIRQVLSREPGPELAAMQHELARPEVDKPEILSGSTKLANPWPGPG
jgi:DNA-binding SARP family transcriptional activator